MFIIRLNLKRLIGNGHFIICWVRPNGSFIASLFINAIMKALICFVFIIFVVLEALAQQLPRRVELGFRIEALPTKGAPGLVIRYIQLGCAIEKSGLQVGDKVVTLDGVNMDSSYAYYHARKVIRPKKPVEVEYVRGTTKRKAAVVFGAAPIEKINNCDIVLSQVCNSGR